MGTTTMQLAFFPGVMLSLQWPFIASYSWFVITLLTCASVSDAIGKLIARKINMRKKCYLIYSLTRNIMFTFICMLTLDNIAPVVFRANWYLVFALFCFAMTFGYLMTIGMKHGTDDSIPNKAIAGKLINLHASLGMCLGSVLGLLLLS